ncbi:putative membrane-associated kinase regulator 4 [Dorcoceras hygrometricum]|uniref:Putative membrane-associated kinase regulator 4 n=1 Tax=Dorcoceras hygrometricum TaxID=472368 RepID=A0A2Z7AWB5_9LAMI|nr:putative membrane-associated kinase regulator 4 [Dorcoceras hygrometricum]
MAKILATDEDYINMELNSTTQCSADSCPHNREFEFQMPSSCCENEAAVFPADELFYRGKLLPLHLPPRLQMVRNLLHTAAAAGGDFEEDDFYYTMPFLSACATAPCTNSNTPLDSCNISPSESCRVSCELNPDDCFFEWSAELSSFVNGNRSRKNSWSKKLKLIKHYSVLGQKLKASTTYVKSLFSTKSSCSYHQSSGKESHNMSKVDETSNQYIKMSKKKSNGVQKARASYPTIANIINNSDKEVTSEDHVHRKSFSGAIKRRNFPGKSSSSNSSSTASSSSSLNSNGFHELQLSGRSSSVTEVECSIEAAIEHCKRSQKVKDSRNLSRD